MPLTDLRPWLLRAHREHFAIGAFNANTMEQAQAIAAAAEAESAPAMIQISHRALQYVGSGNEIRGLQYMAAIGKLAADSVRVPVALHLDHANAEEVIVAMGLGFTSVMFDGGDLPFARNVEVTRKLVEMAHSLGVSIEAEVGAVPRADAAGKVDRASEMTRPEDAGAFVEATHIDALAIAIGSVHAIRSKIVEIDLERLKAIRALVAIPLVLHGSSGVADAFIAEGIQLGLAKINVATQLNQAFTGAIRSQLEQNSDEVDPRKILGPARQEMSARVRERIRFFGSSGQA